MTNKTISVKIPKQIHEKLVERVIGDRYGMRGKSKWIIEAINDFLELDYFPELVDLADEMNELTHMESFRLPQELCNRINDSIIVVRKDFPELEGVKSKIIRASIMQRLIRKSPVPDFFVSD